MPEAVIGKTPFDANVVVKLAPDPVDGLPLGADQVKIMGGTPLLELALHVTGLPAVAEPQVTPTLIVVTLTVTSRVTVRTRPLASVAVIPTWNVVAEVTV